VGPLLPRKSQKIAVVAVLLVAGSVAIVSRTTTGAIVAAAIFLVALVASLVRLRRLLADTERAREEEARRKATLETVLSSIGDAVMATDAAGSITFLNPVAEQLTGWPAGEAFGRPLGEIFRAIDEKARTPVENPALAILRTGQSATLANHTVLLARDGREIPIDDSAAPIPGGRGARAGVVLVFRDVTARRVAQRALEESEHQYRLLFENNPQPMWVYDLETLAFLAVNQAAIQGYGYSREEFLAMTIRDIRPAEDVPRLLANVQSSTGLHTDGPWRHRRKDGSLTTVEIAAHPLRFHSREARLVMVNDISERTSLEQQFHQAQRLESVGRLAGGVAHDFNNLLAVINGYADLLAQDMPAASSGSSIVAEIRAAGERAASLTQQLLAFSRKQLVQPAVLNLNQIVRDVEKMLRRLIGEDIELVIRADEALGNVRADAGHLQQILMNLAVNARDAMPDGGRLLIETANVVLDAHYEQTHNGARSGPHVLLAVSDNGSGMPPEVREHIFEPFFTTKPTGTGTGLGLATVYGMVKQIGGWIWVYSEPAQGSVFKIYLPRADAAVPQPRPEIRRNLRGSETILVVEDQDEVRHMTATALGRYGYRVLTAASGEEAQRLAAGYPDMIHLLLTDVIMPGITGRELAERMTAERRGMAVLYMSGYTDQTMARGGVLDPGVRLLAKPFTPSQLAEKVRDALGADAAAATVLLVSGDTGHRARLRDLLIEAGYAVAESGDGQEAASAVKAGEFDLLIAELSAAEEEITLQAVRERPAGCPTIVLSADQGGEFLTLAAETRAAAILPVPVEREALLEAVRQTLKQ
jgi:two-component system cell cycle sensor histidine kinase/response regulator CckA